MKLLTRFVMAPRGDSALGLPAGDYWAVPDAELARLQAENAALRACVEAADELSVDDKTARAKSLLHAYLTARAELAKLEKA